MDAIYDNPNESPVPSNSEWRDISGYEGVYQISNAGKVKRIKPEHNTFVGKILKPGIDTDGYEHVILGNLGIRRTLKVHRLVATVFIRPPQPGEQVNHKDGNRRNNTVTNLEWLTLQENIDHKVHVLKTQLRGEGIGISKLTEEKVRKIREMLPLYSQQFIADTYGVSQPAIGAIKRNKTWAHVK